MTDDPTDPTAATTGTPGPSATAPARTPPIALLALWGVAASAWSAWLVGLAPGDHRLVPAGLGLAVAWSLPALAWRPRPAPERWHPAAAAGLGLATAAAAVALFALGALVIRDIDPLADAVRDVLEVATRRGGAGAVVVAVANGVGEELFFRQAAWSALPRRRAVVGTTVVYAAAVACTGNVMLVLAAVILGAVTALVRLRTDRVIAAVVTHVVWSLAMVQFLPPLFHVG